MLAQVSVFSFKAGLLAKLAHDLALRVERFEIVLEQRRVRAWFAADSLRVEGVVSGANLDRAALSANDRAQIEATARSQLLAAAEHPRIEFTGNLSETSRLEVSGTLRLRGHDQPLTVTLLANGPTLRASIPLTPSRFAIAPFKTFGGAIRLQDRVVVELMLQLGEAEARTILEKSEATYFRPSLAPSGY